MIRKALVVLAISGLLALLSPVWLHAQSSLAVVDSSVQAEFPLRLRFNLSARSDVSITDIRLRYTVERAGFAQVVSEAYIEFVPATSVKVSWALEMVKIGGLPPGAGVQYWWRLTDAGGGRLETAPTLVRFDDNRYTWRRLTEGEVTIYWYEGNEAFAQELMASARQSLARLASDTGAYLEKPVKLYIYTNPKDLKGAMIYPQEWTGGVAFSREGIIALGVAPKDIGWGRRVIAHELTHLVIHQMTFNPYGGLPTWLNEGLAMYAEGELEPQYVALLKKAIAEGELISVRSLSSPFSAYAQQSYLAYAQSYSLVEFLINRYGRGKMLELLNTFRQGNSYDSALSKVYGVDTEGLDALWRNYVTASARSAAKVKVPPTLVRTLTVPAGVGF